MQQLVSGRMICAGSCTAVLRVCHRDGGSGQSTSQQWHDALRVHLFRHRYLYQPSVDIRQHNICKYVQRQDLCWAASDSTTQPVLAASRQTNKCRSKQIKQQSETQGQRECGAVMTHEAKTQSATAWSFNKKIIHDPPCQQCRSMVSDTNNGTLEV